MGNCITFPLFSDFQWSLEITWTSLKSLSQKDAACLSWNEVLHRRTPKQAAVREISAQEVSSPKDRGANHWFGLSQGTHGWAWPRSGSPERYAEMCGRFIGECSQQGVRWKKKFRGLSQGCGELWSWAGPSEMSQIKARGWAGDWARAALGRGCDLGQGCPL